MIRVIQDVGAPAVVTGIDIATLELAPTWNEWASYIMAGGAYLLSGLGVIRGTGGEFVKNMGIAALPLAARNIYARVKQPVSQRAGAGASRLAFRAASAAAPVSTSNPVRRVFQPEFEPAGAHAI